MNRMSHKIKIDQGNIGPCTDKVAVYVPVIAGLPYRCHVGLCWALVNISKFNTSSFLVTVPQV